MVTERAQTAPSRNGTRTAVLLLGHGSRARGATAAVARVAAEVRERTHFIVAVGFTEYEQPSIDDGFDECVRQGAAEILVVPYFLHMGNHVRRDLPERIAAGQQRYPHVKVVHGPPIGYHPALVDILLERVAETASLAGSRESECGGVRVQALPYPFTAPALPAGKAIEEKSFDTIEQEVGPHSFSPQEFAVVRRVIHATADFDFARNLLFHPQAVDAGLVAIGAGLPIVTDVEMVRTGVLRRCTNPFGVAVHCFISDPEVCARAAEEGSTRAVQAMRRAAKEGEVGILAVGNAPTALLEAIRLVRAGELRVRLVVGAPVGFVSAAESKEALLDLDTPFIAARGRKGGSPVAAAAVNALLHLALEAK